MTHSAERACRRIASHGHRHAVPFRSKQREQGGEKKKVHSNAMEGTKLKWKHTLAGAFRLAQNLRSPIASPVATYDFRGRRTAGRDRRSSESDVKAQGRPVAPSWRQHCSRQQRPSCSGRRRMQPPLRPASEQPARSKRYPRSAGPPLGTM